MDAIVNALPSFLLIFCRITGFFVTVPVFSSRNIPARFKIGLSFFITLIAYGSVTGVNVTIDGLFILSIARETLIGLMLGFVAYLFFTVVQIAGSFMDMQIGFSLANIIDPMSGTPSPILGNFKFMIGTMLFLAFDGHHALIKGIIKSYNWVPLDNNVFARLSDGGVSEFLVKSVSQAFGLALQMSAPIVVALFLVDIGLGILARVAPQFNIFVVGIPVKLIVGLLLLILLVSAFPNMFRELFSTLFDSMENLLRLLGGSPAS
ncbi:flagellar biosynthetic protein FliR [Gorillibacterium timonense]|uniref:flagellar biosynthetic protein FliR n=1 Tax=Gorillibacterium timonense TaxID=1689269 RepID=UPI00071D65C0|nr:flagellar biosynthetic protein FliR [Gorillibacterium timonense]